jgi:hypothetical protein
MHPTHYLRLEGLAALAAAVAAYGWLGGPWWLFLVCFLAPDLSMLAYLAGPRAGSVGYNVVHVYALPLGLAGVSVWAGVPLGLELAAIWAAHIGADRLAGFGLKFESGFKPTHLQPAPPVAPEPTD